MIRPLPQSIPKLVMDGNCLAPRSANFHIEGSTARRTFSEARELPGWDAGPFPAIGYRSNRQSDAPTTVNWTLAKLIIGRCSNRQMDADQVARLLELLALLNRRLLSISTLAKELGLHRESVKSYIAVLERLFLVRRLRPWHRNAAKRLIKSPKMHLPDTGLQPLPTSPPTLG